MNDKYALVMVDVWSRFLLCRPLKRRDAVETLNCSRSWAGNEVVRYLYTDGVPELDWIARVQGIPHDSSEPGDPQANGMAERHVQEVKYGTAAALGQAGLSHRYWSYAMYDFETAWSMSAHRGPDKSPYD